MIKLLVFDLDGTLADTRRDLCNSVNHALIQSGRPPLPMQTVVAGVGDGARNLIFRSLKAADGREASPAETDAVLAAFLEHYRAHCLEESRLYAGVEASLGKLGRYRKAVLTNKPAEPARKILTGLGLEGFFTHVLGGDNPYGRKPEPEGLRHIMAAENAAPEETVMIGDGVQDLLAARGAGTRFLAFLSGMGSRYALLDQGPEAVLENMADLPQALTALDSHKRAAAGTNP